MSLLVNGVLIVPFIDILYRLKLQRADQKTKDLQNKHTPIFDKFHSHKAGTPVGGGILIVIATVFLFGIGIWLLNVFGKDITSNYQHIGSEIKILLFTFISFAALGLYDDVKTIFVLDKKSFYGLRMWHKLIIEIILGAIISYWMVAELKINIVNIPFVGVFDLDWAYVPFATFVIVAFANAVNITDGLDGLSAGVLTITLLAFWVISVTILDTPLLVFIAVWLGGLIAFLYFNVNPARLFLGDTGALSFGATFAIIGLLLGKTFTIPIIGGVFVVEIVTSLVQILSKRFRNGKKVFPAAPLHLWLQYLGWPEHKIVMRAWIFSLFFALVGLMIAFMK
ncbi:MAG: phospho-N-acetylmuramoyl-pentapeptide-transferase [Candidatus Roizmanbacteria bacterium]